MENCKTKIYKEAFEKVKAYDEAIEKAKALYQAAEPMSGCNVLLETIFPELKESEEEDEGIRKGLINYFNDFTLPTFGGLDPKKILAWLEKQGQVKYSAISQHKNITSKENDNSLTSEDEKIRKEIISFLKEGKPYHCPNSAKRQEWATWLEKQGEQNPIDKIDSFKIKKDPNPYWTLAPEYQLANKQKPADKVEPKFKVKYANSEYNVLETKDIAGVTFYGIEDEPNHIDYVKAEDCKIISGYGIKENGSPYPTKPAVFSEQKPAWSEEDEYTLGETIQHLEELIRIEKVKHCDIDVQYYQRDIDWLKSLKDRVLSQPKQEWSEDDEPLKELAETYLAVFDKHFPILPTLKGKQLADYKNFLNQCQQIFGLKYWGIHPIQAKLFEKLSLLWAVWGTEHLKGLGQTDGDGDTDNKKQEWSEEDESYLNTTIAYLKDAKEFKKTAENCINWLKSLRPKLQWKPSDEQMKQLGKYCPDNTALTTLYEYLKQL